MARKPITELTGGVIRGMLTVIGEAPSVRKPNGNFQRYAICRCECGSVKNYQPGNLKFDKQRHCGCGNKKPYPRLPIEELCGGKFFGSLTLIKEVPGKAVLGNGAIRMAICRCSCGSEKEYFPQNLKKGASTSCGCKRPEKCANAKLTHGESIRKSINKKCSREYQTWCNMISRCENKNDNSYENYGGRGISVCERWRNSYENFLEDMGRRPRGKEIDRFPDNDGNYEPGNVRWATKAEQARNKRTNHMITFQGETLCLDDMSSKYGFRKGTVGARINKYGWSIEDALTTPLYERR